MVVGAFWLPMEPTDPFVATFALDYTYRRSLGPVLSRFFTALRDRELLGARTATGRVVVPPCEYDPETGADIVDLIPVGPLGTVTSWSLTNDSAGWALVRLDGADTALLHRIEASALQTGQRVRPRWATETTGTLEDIVCFEPIP